MAEMASKERLLNAITGKEVDRTPWSPFLAYYWEHQPQEVQQLGQVQYMRQLGADPLLRGFHQLFRTKVHNCDFRTVTKGNKKQDTFETKVGTLQEEYTWSATANSWFLTGHSVKTEEDFKTLQYMCENTEVIEYIENFERDYYELGDKGLYLPVIGLYAKTAFQSLVERWCGTVDLTYALYDFPEVVEECLATIQEKDRETVRFSLNSPAEGFIFWEDSSTTNVSPDLFARYTAPQINEWGKMIHAQDRLLIHHACGLLKHLLPLMAKTEVDMIESVSPPPTGDIEIEDALAILPQHIGIIGGIEPTFFEKCTFEELESNVKHLVNGAKGKRFILANSDSCPPGVTHQKFELVSKLVHVNHF